MAVIEDLVAENDSLVAVIDFLVAEIDSVLAIFDSSQNLDMIDSYQRGGTLLLHSKFKARGRVGWNL